MMNETSFLNLASTLVIPYQELIASSPLVFADCWGSSYGTDGGAPRVFDIFFAEFQGLRWIFGF